MHHSFYSIDLFMSTGKSLPSTANTKSVNDGGHQNTEEIKIYKKRFYILAVYSIASVFQIFFWNTWSPIADTGIGMHYYLSC